MLAGHLPAAFRVRFSPQVVPSALPYSARSTYEADDTGSECSYERENDFDAWL